MSDEEYGRAWAKQVGMKLWARPAADDPTAIVFAWLWSEFPESLPRFLYHLIRPNFALAEGDIYAQLGRAVREYHTAVPRLEVPT